MNTIKPRTLAAEQAPAPPSPPGTACGTPRAPSTPVDSTALLQGQRTVEISHHGEIYRLQATRLGKLILTK